jgi:hypothetical protein
MMTVPVKLTEDTHRMHLRMKVSREKAAVNIEQREFLLTAFRGIILKSVIRGKAENDQLSIQISAFPA